MKRVEFVCDICGGDIHPTTRVVPIQGRIIKSCCETYYRFIFQQVNKADNHAEREASVDMCDECYYKIDKLIKELNHEAT